MHAVALPVLPSFCVMMAAVSPAAVPGWQGDSRSCPGDAACGVQQAKASSEAEAACKDASPGKNRKVHKTKDGSTFVFDAESRSWRLVVGDPPPDGAAAASPLALEWSQFQVTFDGGFEIAGQPLILDANSTRRASHEQLHGDTGSSVWDGAVAMAKFLEANPGFVREKRVLELGSGRGVVGLAGTLLGAKHVVMTDLDYCLEALQQAAERTLAHAKGTWEVCALDWFSPSGFTDSRPPEERFDVLLAADVVWLSELAQPLAAALGWLAARSPGAEVLVVHQTRSSAVEESFLSAMAAMHFDLAWALPGGEPEAPRMQVKSPPGVAWHPGYRPDGRIVLWCFRHTPPAVAGPA